MTTRPRGRPRAEPSDVQRRRILDAARAHFTDHGYDGTTVAGIARQAQVTRAVVYETVGDKEALLVAVADEVTAEVVEAFDRRINSPDAVDRPLGDLVRDLVVWFMELIASEPAITAMVGLTGRIGDVPGDHAARARSRMEDRLTQLHLERGAHTGEGARLLAVMVLTLVEGTAFRAATEPGWSSPAAAQVTAEFVIAGYRRIVVERPDLLVAFDGDEPG